MPRVTKRLNVNYRGDTPAMTSRPAIEIPGNSPSRPPSLLQVRSAVPCNTLSDRHLLDDWITRHDDAAITELIGRHQAMLEGVIMRIVRDHTQTQDIIQESLIKFCDQAHTIEGEVGAWLRRVATNAAIDHLRSHQRRRAHEERVVQQADWKISSNPEGAPLSDLVAQCIATMSSADRDLIVRLYFEGRSQRDIAKELSVSAVTIHKRTQACLDRLRQQMGKQGVRISATALLLCLGRMSGVPVAASTSVATAAAVLTYGTAFTAAAVIAGLVVTAGVGSILVAGWSGESHRDANRDVQVAGPVAALPQEPGAMTPRVDPVAVGIGGHDQDDKTINLRSLPRTCWAEVSSTGWMPSDPKTWVHPYNFFHDLVPLLGLRPEIVQQDGRWIKLRTPVHLGSIPLGIPTPAGWERGFQVRMTIRPVVGEVAGAESLQVFTALRRSAAIPQADEVEFSSCFTGGMDQTPRLIYGTRKPLEKTIDVLEVPLYPEVSISPWDVSPSSTSPEMEKYWFSIFRRVDIRDVQVRILSAEELTQIVAFISGLDRGSSRDTHYAF